MARKNSKIEPGKKKLINCYECGASFSLDLSAISPEVTAIKCLNCEKEVPILARLIHARQKEGADPARSVSALPEKKSLTNHRDIEEDFYPTGFGVSSAEAQDEEGMQWLATYGDLMSILLIFFILLFAVSTVDMRKYKAAMTSISAALGKKIIFSQAVPTPAASLGPESIEELKARLEAARKLSAPLVTLKQEVHAEDRAFSALRTELTQFIKDNHLEDKISLVDENEGLVVIIRDMVMFDLGSAEIRPGILPYLKKIASIFKDLKNTIVVEGHTDNLPVTSGKYASNWELSVMRATNVVHIFISQCALDPSRFSAAGYAFYRPRYQPAENEKNRRIELIIKRKFSRKLVDELLVPKQ